MNKLCKVLIVEDDKYILKAMDYKFREAGLDVRTTPLAEEGLKILASWLPDVIILDILLPGIDGYAFLREVQKDPVFRKIPVIIASNLSVGDDDMDLGASEYIVKSDLDLDELVKKVKNLSSR